MAVIFFLLTYPSMDRVPGKNFIFRELFEDLGENN